MNSGRFAVERMCRVLRVSRGGYYAWLDRPPSARQAETAEMRRLIRKAHSESRGRYGSPRITASLRAEGLRISRPRVARLMRLDGLRSIVKKRHRPSTTDSRHGLAVSPNLLDRNFRVSAPARAWVSDITYVRTGQGWLYLTVVLDLFDRRVIGWSLSRGMQAGQTSMAAFRMAVGNRPLDSELTFHSDRGVQYACTEFRRLLRQRGVTQSMSRKGNCWDNAVAESFFKTLKSEMADHQVFIDVNQAKVKVFEFIEIWYNRKRIHSHLGYIDP